MDVTKLPQFKQIIDFDKNVRCIPEFEEIRQVEYVRQSGKINMICDDLVGELDRLGLVDGIEWVLRCRKLGSSWASIYEQTLEYFEKKHGPRETWIDDEYRERVLETEQMITVERLEAELRAVRARMKRPEARR